ncbi:MAG: benzoate/H(+) symporter BenE family transporter [Chloroflexi bacterium]|nr:benzoate/H(+) symporter BenE family transporter [Chloroflexota bacterium]
MQTPTRNINYALANLRDLPNAILPSAVFSALVAVLTGYAGPLLVMFQVAEVGKLSQAQLSSTIWAVTIGCGVCAILLSLWYRHPVLCAWPSAGAVLLVTSLATYTFSEAIGAFIIQGVLLILLGLSGWFGRLMEIIPRTVVAGMLGGVLFRFGIGVFTAIPTAPLLVGAMIATFVIMKRLGYRAPMIGAMVIGLMVAAAQGQIKLDNFVLALTVPVVTLPTFNIAATLGLALPLFVLTLTGQNAPGVAVLRNSGYNTPVDGPITLTGIASLLTAPIGGNGINLSAITAAICTNPEAHPDKTKRYSAGVAYGLWYVLFGMFGATAVALFSSVPKAFVAAITGLALLGAISTALSTAMSEPKERDGALMAFMLTASGVEILSVGAPFWGLLLGVVVNTVLNRKFSHQSRS